MTRQLASATLILLGALVHGERPSLSRNTTTAKTPTHAAEPSIRRVGALRSARSAQTATAIAGNRVLVAGGMQEGGAALRSFELFDASTNQVVTAGDMAEARAGHTATLLPSGRVL